MTWPDQTWTRSLVSRLSAWSLSRASRRREDAQHDLFGGWIGRGMLEGHNALRWHTQVTETCSFTHIWSPSWGKNVCIFSLLWWHEMGSLVFDFNIWSLVWPLCVSAWHHAAIFPSLEAHWAQCFSRVVWVSARVVKLFFHPPAASILCPIHTHAYKVGHRKIGDWVSCKKITGKKFHIWKFRSKKFTKTFAKNRACVLLQNVWWNFFKLKYFFFSNIFATYPNPSVCEIPHLSLHTTEKDGKPLGPTWWEIDSKNSVGGRRPARRPGLLFIPTSPALLTAEVYLTFFSLLHLLPLFGPLFLMELFKQADPFNPIFFLLGEWCLPKAPHTHFLLHNSQGWLRIVWPMAHWLKYPFFSPRINGTASRGLWGEQGG